MRNKSISIATIFTAGSVAIVLIVLAISVNIAGYFFFQRQHEFFLRFRKNGANDFF